MSQGLVVTNRESTIGSLSQFSQNFPFSAVIVISPKDIFLVDGLSLLRNAAFSQEGTSEKIGDSFDGFNKGLIRDFKIVVGFNIRCISVVHSRVLIDEGRVLIMDRELFRAHEEHVFQEVSEAQ